MRSSRWVLLSGGLLAGALLSLCAARAADPAPKPPSPPKAPAAPPVGESTREARPPLLLDAARVAPKAGPARLVTRRPAPLREERIIPWPDRMSVGLEVLVDGRPLPTIRHEGKTYLPVPRVGAEYEIRVWNHGPRRVAAVVSVDGLSVINGRTASEAGPGYLVTPYSSIVIRGWRRDLDTVAAFRFVDREKSYAGLTGRPENIGVIGLVAIEELVLRRLPELEKRDSAGSSASKARLEAGSIGTEYGRDVDSWAYYVPFVRSSNKRSVTLYYDTPEALRAAGVPVDRPSPVPFPGDGEFAPPPPGYKKG